jgi:outer membrane protein assembly factor BamB
MAKAKGGVFLLFLAAGLTVLVFVLFMRAHGRSRLLDAAEDDDPPSELQLDSEKNLVLRRDAQGGVRWSTPVEGRLWTIRPPSHWHDDGRAYVAYEGGVIALDWDTGQLIWRSEGAADGLCLSGDLLLATGSEKTGDEEWTPYLCARNTTTGAEAFRVSLPFAHLSYRLQSVHEVGGLFVAQLFETIDGEGAALVIDRRGRVRHRLGREVVAAVPQGEDCVFVTSQAVVRLSAEDRVRWLTPFEQPFWFTGGGIVSLADGQLLAFMYGQITDSGVQVVRLDPADGTAIWRAWCAPLGVGHSEYLHTAKVAIEGDRVRVKSRGSGGRFVEVLDLNTGKQVERAESEKHGF